MATRNDLEIFRGEDVVLNFTMSPTVDITGWTIRFFCGELEVSATLTAPSTGNFSVTLTREQTGAWTPGRKMYDVWRIDSASAVVLAHGAIDIFDVARETP